MSASWLACTLTLDRWVPKWIPFLYAIFGLRLALVDPTDRYLRAWKPVPSCLQFDQQRVLSRFFLPPFPSFSLFQRPPSPSWRNKKPRLRSWKLEPNPTVIREGRTERKTTLETICGAVFDSTLTSDCTDFEFADHATSLKSEANIQKREWQPNSPDHFIGSPTDMYGQ